MTIHRKMYRAWGLIPRQAQRAIGLDWSDDAANCVCGATEKVLAFGNGRSYGDVCLNQSGMLIDTEGLDNVLEFNDVEGTILCEAGVRIADILKVVVPQAWILPVLPGTRYITVGGAIANDIHGKNHLSGGTFGCHVEEIILQRSDGELLKCSRRENKKWFEATVGGLGLTGLILAVRLRLKRITSMEMRVSTNTFVGFDEMLSLSDEKRRSVEYLVGWLDMCGGSASSIRGAILCADHGPGRNVSKPYSTPVINVPCASIYPLIRRSTVGFANRVQYMRMKLRKSSQIMDIYRFFFPLDRVVNWNGLYGRRGLAQFQFVVERASILGVMDIILLLLRRYRQVPTMGVLKVFGSIQSPGLISFPREGITVAIDMKVDANTEKCVVAMNQLVAEHGGAVYPAKDRFMTREQFEVFFPGIGDFKNFIDPGFQSDFQKRVMS